MLGKLTSLIEQELPQAIALRRELHAEPEPGGLEQKTSQRIAAALPVPARFLAGTTNVVARVGSPGSGILVRAELDGLELQEETGAAYSSANGHMHGCGHDIHCAALVAFLRAAHRMQDELPAPLLAVFQASEERSPSGALTVLADPELRRDTLSALGVHVHPGLPWGTFGAEPGTVNAQTDAFEIVVDGYAGHGAYPHTTRDPVLTLAQVIVALHTLVGRRVDPLNSAVLSVGSLAAGSSDNVIPARARALGTLRTLHAEDHQVMRAAIEETVEQISAAHGCVGKVNRTRQEPALVNDPGLTAAVRALAVREGVALAPAWRSCGGDDFARYGECWPSLMSFVGLRGAPGFAAAGLHHPAFLPPDEAVRAVAVAQALAYLGAVSTAP